MCNTLDIIVIILMIVALITIIVYNVYEIISANKYYKECKKAHEKYLEEIINTLKTEEK